MLTRRHIRVKVMQSLYAYSQSENRDIETEAKFLRKSMDDMYDLFLLMLNLMVETKNYAESYWEKASKKHISTPEDALPHHKFINNEIINRLDNNSYFNEQISDRKLTNWSRDDEYKTLIWNSLLNSQIYKNYMSSEAQSFDQDKEFVLEFFSEIIAPNDKLYDYLEDHKLTWLDDLPIVNTTIHKMLERTKESSKRVSIPRLYRNIEDKDFAAELLRITILNDANYTEEISSKTPNWDKERIAPLDAILMKLAICEFLEFSSIPVKVSINEYLEIAKEYSTPKSSIFINGILDKLSKEYKSNKRLNKTGRGLM